MSSTDLDDVTVTEPIDDRTAAILTPGALALVVRLQRQLGPRREELLAARAERRTRLAAGELLGFLPETREVREGDWSIAPAPPDLADRRVEITGPVDRKMIINALNSGARAFMADFEDSMTPSWENVVAGQQNLIDAVRGTIELKTEDGREYRLGEQRATLIVRPRGWHLPERHVLIDGQPVSASLFDFGLYVFHNAERLLAGGSGPYLYLPKMESHLEARLWNDAFLLAQEELGLEVGTIRATVLIETVPAAFEMEEILYELRDHVVGLNAGRWDYIFSMIKCFRERPEFLQPDRNDVRMTVPFMRAYTELLVSTCHRRGAHAMGGMAALIPSRRDAEANARAIAAVQDDKRREATDGFDGTWVAHPDLVPVAQAEFDAVLGIRPNQLDRLRAEVEVGAADLLAVAATPGKRTEAGLRNNVDVGIRYLWSWLNGNGAAAIHGLMEDAATAEIARSQVWQWLYHQAELDDGQLVTRELAARVIEEEHARIRSEAPAELHGLLAEARELFEQLALADELAEFLTLTAYDRL